MKKITLLLCLTGFAAFAQFPNPYCNITEYEDVEEITFVNFAGATITNSSAASVLLDFTATIANVNANQSYTIQVKGDSYGDYDNEYVAYIDWNHNNILDDAGEVFYIGLLTDTDGLDAATASTSIAVPATALPGNTRIRILKVWTDQADDYILNYDPCSITVEDDLFGGFYASYGQALDFTVNVAALDITSLDKNALVAYPNPAKDFFTVNYQSDIDEVRIYNLIGQEVLAKSIGQSEFQLDLSGLSSGSYVVKLFAATGQHSLKLIKE